MWNACSGLVTAVILIGLFYTQGFAPFGNKSLAYMDASVQYLDFYAYYQDVLQGENSFLYSFGKSLGGTNIATFSYYLASPFCLLICLFDKTELQSYFDWCVLLKLSLAASAFGFFLRGRFHEKIDRLSKEVLMLLLSVSYALCQYCIAQSSNIMWLDGVYLLPVMMLYIYRLVQGKDGWKLSIVVGLSIVFNWYTAGINCVFSAFWFLFEYLLSITKERNLPAKEMLKNTAARVFQYGISMVLGVMLSLILFLPTISALQNSTRGGLEFELLTNLSFIGRFPSVIENYVYGAVSKYGSVALFAGNAAMIGCISCFFSSAFSRIQKIVFGTAALFGVMMFYWNPLYVSFSLFKGVGSFWYRYSYLGAFVVLFLAAAYYLSMNRSEEYIIPIRVGMGYSALLLILDYASVDKDFQQTYSTALTLLLLSGVLSLLFYYEYHRRNAVFLRILTLAAVFGIGICELSYNAKLLMDVYYIDDETDYVSYTEDAEKQIDAIQSSDDGMYRIAQTSTRRMLEGNTTVNYNEALAYNYWSISGYTSSPDDNQRFFLDRLGYRCAGSNMCATNTSILGADSLLGVKYVLSQYSINGLIKQEQMEQRNGKDTYKNPYCLSMAFIYQGSDHKTDTMNPFVYQNSIYSQLLGRDVELYTPLHFRVKQQGDAEANRPLRISVDIPEGEYAVYGNLPWNSVMDAKLKVNNTYEIEYTSYLSQSVFYIPTNGKHAEIMAESADHYDFSLENAQFYALNLDRLKEVTEELSAETPEEVKIQNGEIFVCAEDCKKGDSLFLSVPYDKGWQITVNGTEVQPKLIGDCLYSIDLENGSNEVRMIYRVRYFRIGAVLSLTAAIGIGIIRVLEKKRYQEKMS